MSTRIDGPTAPAADGEIDPSPGAPAHPPILGRLLSGTFWLALKTPIQVIVAFWSVPLVQHHIGKEMNGAYVAAWGFAFLQFLLEFGMSSALQRQVSDAWTRGDRAGVDRSIACGMSFYAAVAVAQVATLAAIVAFVVPTTDYHGAARALFVKLLWLQAAVAPCFGLSMVATSVLQAARRYEFIPKFELAVVVLRFAVLWLGLHLGVDFFLIVAAQTLMQIALLLGPALWVMTRDLGYRPHFRGATWADWRALSHISAFMAVMQISVVLADKIDTTVLTLALRDPGPQTTIYQNVSKGFNQVRQTGWMLTSLVMPAVAGLAASRDSGGLERLKYDGPRFLVGLLLPVALCAAIYARPFLVLWVGPEYGQHAHLMRLFLVATLPLVVSVHVQIAIGMQRIAVIALAALAGSVVNLPLSYYLTLRWQAVDGVIWGTVLTTLFSNLLVPAAYTFRALGVRPGAFARRSLVAPVAGASLLVAAALVLRPILPADPPDVRGPLRYAPFGVNLGVAVLAYVVGYALIPVGRADLAALAARLLRRRRASA